MKSLFFAFIFFYAFGNAQEAEALKMFLAAESESEIQLFLNFTETLNPSEGCNLALQGTALAMSASFGFNPITKLDRFSDGKKLIEAGIIQSHLEPCSHFCRLAVQSQSPRFLGYNEHIDKDAVIVVESLRNGWLLNNLEIRGGLILFIIEETEISADLKAELEIL